MGRRGLTAAVLWAAARLAWGADAATHVERAGQSWGEGDRDRAMREYDAALATGGESALVRHNRAVLLLELGDPGAAREEAARAAALAPGEGRYLVTAAAAWMADPDPNPKRARTLLRKAVRLMQKQRDHAGLGKAWYNLGLLARRAGNLRDARRCFTLALEHDASDERTRAALEALDAPRR